MNNKAENDVKDKDSKLTDFELFNEYFRYDAETGIITRKKRTGNCTKVGEEVGWLTEKGYLSMKFKGKTQSYHRVAWLLYYKEWPKGQIDHIDQDKLNNKIINLRDVEPHINCRNKPLTIKNTSGYVGVVWNKQVKKWQAQGKLLKKNYHLGYFDDIMDAVKARAEWEKGKGFTELHGK